VKVVAKWVFSAQLLTFILLGFQGCVEEGREWVFGTIVRGEHSEIDEERHEVIRDQEAWTSFWKSHDDRGSPPPRVNFREEMVIAVHLGTRPTSGYAVTVTKVTTRKGTVTVSYDEVRPGPRCVVVSASTQPYHIIMMPATPHEPQFAKHDRTEDCG
jgi:hypothetical protein